MRILKIRSLTLLLLALGMIPSAGAQTTVGRVTLSKVSIRSTAVLGSGKYPGYNPASQPSTTKPDYDLLAARQSSASHSTSTRVAASLSVPSPTPNPVTGRGSSVSFPGLTTVDTANANGFVATPPDQGLCVGHGFVMEAINLAMAVYSEKGAQLTVPESLYTLFGADPSANTISDPRCYYDQQTQRWFVSVTNVIDFTTGRSNLYLAVSQSSDPRGAYAIYSIDTTDDGLNGTPNNPGCTTALPCFGDQPTLGADANGIYITTNEFGIFTNVFNGAQIYALSKADLVAGAPLTLVHIGNLPLAEGIAYSVQPASSPDLSEAEGNGTEYFLSALDFFNLNDNRIAVWALTNTGSLTEATPTVSLTNVVIRSEVYGIPPLATQKAGPYPLGQALGDAEETLNTGDDRMQQVVYADGHLWGALNTAVRDRHNYNSGIAYFDVTPKESGGVLSATMQGQNYVSVRGASVMYPAVAVTADGSAAAAFTLSGPSYFPSAAYAKLMPNHATGVNIVALGTAPQDDFSGYPQYGGSGYARWGDYSWAVADGGSIWMATEYIPGGIDSTYYYTDFGTLIYNVNAK